MRHALLRHRKDIVALLMLMVVALAVAAWILLQQPAFQPPSWLRPEDKNRYEFKAEFGSSPAIVAGQGQTVNIAGVTVGDVKDVELEGGKSVLTLSIRRKYAPLYRDASVLIRPRTALKDMYIALDPGTPASGELPQNATISSGATEADVNYDEILGNLDADTRAYLNLLLGSGAEAFRDDPDADPGAGAPSKAAVEDLRGTFKQFEPLAADSRRLFSALAERRENLRRAVHDLQLVFNAVGEVNDDLAGLIDASNRTFTAFAAQNDDLRNTLSELPPTLERTDAALIGLTDFSRLAAPTMTALRPFARALGPALADTRPFFRESVPAIRTQLLPFSRNVQPVFDELRPATRVVAKVLPEVDTTVQVINRFFNALAFNPEGREEGFLFWGAWLAHIGPSVFGTQDAHGAMPRAVILSTCAQLDAIRQVELGNPSLGPILRQINLADRQRYCDVAEETPTATATPTTTATPTPTTTAVAK